MNNHKQSLDYFVHPNALCETVHVGKDTHIWAFAHILPGAKLGEDCNICDGVFIENDVKIGNRVTIKNGVQLWDGIEIGDDVFIGPNATFTNDPFPRSKQHLEGYLRTVILNGASIGANATILPGIVVGQNAMVGAGAVVTKSVPANAVIIGNPGRIIDFTGVNSANVTIDTHVLQEGAQYTAIPDFPGVTVHTMPMVSHAQGDITFGEYAKNLPFIPKRYFVITNVPVTESRGHHAHRSCIQFLICLRGSCAIVVGDGMKMSEVVLDHATKGVCVSPMIWASIYKFTGDAVLLVLASEVYDPEDYIRDYNVFLSERKS